MIVINNKVYRNLQEQVAENAKDIEKLEEREATYATKTELATVVSEAASTYATKVQLSEVVSDIEVVYATKAQLNSAVSDIEETYATKTALTNGLATKQDVLHLYDHAVRLELSSTEHATLTAEVFINVINTNNANLNTYALLEEYVADETFAVSGWVDNNGVRDTAYTISFYGSDELDIASTNGSSATFDTISHITDFKKQII